LIRLLPFIVILAGCFGSSRDSQTRTAERIETSTGPLVLHTPIGDIVAEPVRHQMVRTQTEVTQEERHIIAPDMAPIMQAAAGGSPLGIAGGILGLITAGVTGWKAVKNGRQRDELIDGIERSKEKLGAQGWEALTGELEKEQSADTKRAVAKRTG
jgi:hypothetical protein